MAYQFNWLYVYGADAGEDVRLLLERYPQKLFSLWEIHDFWMFDEETVVRQRHDHKGHAQDLEEVTDPREAEEYRTARDVALKCSRTIREVLKADRVVARSAKN